MQSPYIINRSGKLEKFQTWNLATFKKFLGGAMSNPIHKNLDYHNIARRIFLIDQLPDGALPIYYRDKADE